ncbi:MAG: 30S ribosomal protein S17e [Nitrososphaerales archaeon]
MKASLNRIRRLSMMLLEKHSSLFTTDFEKNKEVLSQIAVIRSKELRNEIAGYITRIMKSNQLKTQEKNE